MNQIEIIGFGTTSDVRLETVLRFYSGTVPSGRGKITVNGKIILDIPSVSAVYGSREDIIILLDQEILDRN